MYQALNATPLVSIALATFNGEKFIHEQLDSLVNQTYPNLEIVISDDGSTDGTVKILETYAARHPHISIYFNEGEAGVKKNFENSLRHCKADFIALSDQDDIWMPEKIEKLMRQLGNASLIYHNSLLVDEGGKSLHKTVVDKEYSGSNPKVFLLKNVVSGHSCLFKKEILSSALPFPPGMLHDWWLAAIAADQHGIAYLPEILVHYRQHADNASDFLGTRSLNTKQSAYEIYSEEMLRFQSFKQLKRYQSFFQDWYVLNKTKTTKWFCFRLFYLCITNNESLFLLFNKNKFSVFFRCIAYLWGIMLKRLVDKKYNFVDG